MNIPAFTAEASLCKTNGHYRTGRYMVNLAAQPVSPVWPAVEDQGGDDQRPRLRARLD
jgi:hypothetical protein